MLRFLPFKIRNRNLFLNIKNAIPLEFIAECLEKNTVPRTFNDNNQSVSGERPRAQENLGFSF